MDPQITEPEPQRLEDALARCTYGRVVLTLDLFVNNVPRASFQERVKGLSSWAEQVASFYNPNNSTKVDPQALGHAYIALYRAQFPDQASAGTPSGGDLVHTR